MGRLVIALQVLAGLELSSKVLLAGDFRKYTRYPAFIEYVLKARYRYRLGRTFITTSPYAITRVKNAAPFYK